ncbi:hypothetical protein [Sporolactobacillus sp. KGMB 08714]|uniref:hypothetical protein n=1 Tax=Sporolactobacillus sp. KGMB 08714 TaxID=3064704 RepID=UPI002FBD6A4A
MGKQDVIDVLNSLEVLERNGGEDAYILVANNEENRKKLNAVGVSNQEIFNAGDNETFCILALAFNGGYADDYDLEKGLIIREPRVEKAERERVLAGEGTAGDAQHLLSLLDHREEEIFRLNKEIYDFKNNVTNELEQDYRKRHQVLNKRGRNE